MGDRLPVQPAALAELCQRHQIRKLSLFGSMLKGTARPDSDVDLLVEFLPDARPTLLDMAQIEIELSQLLDGRRVDLRTAQDLSRYFRDEVVRTAEPQYVAGCRGAAETDVGNLERGLPQDAGILGSQSGRGDPRLA
jgi:predicted nucleotidyltransferase